MRSSKELCARRSLGSQAWQCIATERFVDRPPRSRNEALASLMRRIGICEERGSGWDKVVFQTEYFQLPAPLAEAPEGCTRAVLFAPRPLNRMVKADRVRALYLHACLRYVNNERLTNPSVRDRFGIALRNSASASRLIREALEAGSIMAEDPGCSKAEAVYSFLGGSIRFVTLCPVRGPKNREI
jgi:predicted HTH transcriptional regulator